MRTIIFFVLFFASSHALTEYHREADKEYVAMTKSSVVFFPEFIFSNEEDKSILKVSRKGETGLFFRPEPTNQQFTLHGSQGQGVGNYVLSSFRFDFKKEETILTLLFDLQTPEPHKLMVTSKAFSFPEDAGLQKHAEEHAVFIEPITVPDIQILKDEQQNKSVITTMPLSISWIKKIIEHTPPLMTKQSRSADIQEYLSPPVVMDPEVLRKLSELRMNLKR